MADDLMQLLADKNCELEAEVKRIAEENKGLLVQIQNLKTENEKFRGVIQRQHARIILSGIDVPEDRVEDTFAQMMGTKETA